MMSLSSPKSAAQAVTYHEQEFSNARENYYSEGDRLVGQWHGALAAQWGLSGDVDVEQYARLAHGQHPITGAQLVRHQTSRDTATGKATMEHRAGWDATFSAPKSVSLTGLVGGDASVREAHRIAVDRALAALEPYVQARLGGNTHPETTGAFVAARFEHDSARPVRGYAAPQIHTHVFVFNMAETTSHVVKPIQPRQLFKSQQYATAVYRSELAAQLHARGYAIERGETDQPEIVGYSTEYLEAASPRRKQIEDRLAELGLSGAKASEIAALDTRESKRTDLTHDEVQRQHQEMAARFGHQPDLVVAKRQPHAITPPSRTTAEAAVIYARDTTFERSAVVDRRALLTAALVRSMGSQTVQDVHTAFQQRIADGTFVAVTQRPGSPSQAYTTPQMMALERENIARMQQGQTDARPLAAAHLRRDIEDYYQHLSEHLRDGVTRMLASTHQIQALNGFAGTGKTTALSAVRDQAEREGYQVAGFAPTSKATKLMVDAGIQAVTLQRYLEQHPEPDHTKHLYVLDEASLASTPQVNALLTRVERQDRILLVGDEQQHEAVDAGAPYRQLLNAGIYTTRLEEIVRQQDPEFKAVVERLARGETQAAIANLDQQGRVHEVTNRRERYQAIADEYLKHPESTLVVAPDNQARGELNAIIHRAGQQAGWVQSQEHRTTVLVARNDLTGPDRQWAARYEVGDVLRFSKGSKAVGIKAGDYARVDRINEADNTLRVLRSDRIFLTYDPKRLHGVTVFREADRAFAVGDRVQFTAPDKTMKVANRELGTIEVLTSGGTIDIRMDDGRHVAIDSTRQHVHMDHGYALTSYSSQGQTADYVLFHADTSDRVAVSLSNQRLAYVALSRSRLGVEIFTDSRERLPQVLSREVNQATALEQTPRHDHARGFSR